MNGKRTRIKGFVASVAMLGMAAAFAHHSDDPRTRNMHPMGHDEEAADLLGRRTGNPDIHTDIAFQDRYAFQGNWNGFRVLDISAPGNPKPISFTRCEGDQGDVSVWENILVRSTNSANRGGRTCDGQPVPEGFEGLHIFDISDLKDPVLVATVPIEDGSHTHTLVPDLANDRVLIYNSASHGHTSEIAIVQIPLASPASAAQIGAAQLQGDGISDCHDISVFTGDVNLAVCAGDAEANVFDISDPAAPTYLYGIKEPGVGDGTILPDGTSDRVGWHSATFSWDGEIIVLGAEPGGGVGEECGSDDWPSKRTLFFYNAADGSKAGEWTLQRTQDGETENCTLHNFNTVPLRSGRRVLVMGNYQAGTNAIDFTDPANAYEFAFSDPDPVEGSVIAAGAWSTYWYNNFVYETNIEEGLNIFRVSDRHTAGAIRLERLNPQTQTFRIEPEGRGQRN